MKKKVLLFLLVFIYGLAITFYYLVPSYNLDGYCQLSMGYSNYAQVFFVSGRFVTGAIWYLFNVFNVSHNIVSIISAILTNVFLGLSVVEIYNSFLKYADSFLKKVILLISSLLIIYNPYVMEIFIYEESFVMALSILFVIIASRLCFNKKYVWGALLLILANMMYQGNACLFIPYYFLMLLFENKDKSFIDLIKVNYKRIIATGIVYGISLIVVYVLMKLYINIFNVYSVRSGEVNIIENIKLIIAHIIGDLRTHQCMIHTYVFNGVLALLFGFVVIHLVLKKKYNQVLYLCILMAFVICFAFVPNLVMPSDSNYIAARMIVSCGAIIGFVSLCSLLIDKRLIVVLIIISGFFVYNSYNYIISANHDHIRYKNDMEELDLIQSNIEKYENVSGNKITEIRYKIDPNSDAFFYFGNIYSVFSQKVLHNDWGFVCGVQGVIDNKYIVTEMSSEDYKLYFADKKYDVFSENNMIFKDNILYILIF